MGAGCLKECGCGQAHIRYLLGHLCPWLWLCHSRCPPKGLWSKGESMLENIHLEASVAVREDMLEYIKVCGYNQAHDRAGTSLEGFQLWVSRIGAGLFLKGL